MLLDYFCKKNFFVFLASQLAFDQYGQLSEQLETESELRNTAEKLATQVRKFSFSFIIIVHLHFLLSVGVEYLICW